MFTDDHNSMRRSSWGFDFGLEYEPWRDEALCAQTDPEAFFPEKGGTTRPAKKICYSCEVRLECLQYALDHDERFGIWGGLSERERRRLKRGEVPEIVPKRKPPRHGTYSCYQSGCRCTECCAGRAAYERDLRARKKESAA